MTASESGEFPLSGLYGVYAIQPPARSGTSGAGGGGGVRALRKVHSAKQPRPTGGRDFGLGLAKAGATVGVDKGNVRTFPTTNANAVLRQIETSQSLVTISVTKPSRDCAFGMGMIEVRQGSVKVSAIAPNSLFVDTKLKVGMTLLSINGRPCPTCRDCVTLLKMAEGRVTIQAASVAAGSAVSTDRRGCDATKERAAASARWPLAAPPLPPQTQSVGTVDGDIAGRKRKQGRGGPGDGDRCAAPIEPSPRAPFGPPDGRAVDFANFVKTAEWMAENGVSRGDTSGGLGKHISESILVLSFKTEVEEVDDDDGGDVEDGRTFALGATMFKRNNRRKGAPLVRKAKFVVRIRNGRIVERWTDFHPHTIRPGLFAWMVKTHLSAGGDLDPWRVCVLEDEVDLHDRDEAMRLDLRGDVGHYVFRENHNFPIESGW